MSSKPQKKEEKDAVLFHIGDILSITTGNLVGLVDRPPLPNGEKAEKRDHPMDAVYEILEFMTGDKDLMTHALLRANESAKPVLLKQFPQLAGVKMPEVPYQQFDKDFAEARGTEIERFKAALVKYVDGSTNPKAAKDYMKSPEVIINTLVKSLGDRESRDAWNVMGTLIARAENRGNTFDKPLHESLRERPQAQQIWKDFLALEDSHRKYTQDRGNKFIKEWMAGIEKEHGAWLPVKPLDFYLKKDPTQEAEDMGLGKKMIGVGQGPDGEMVIGKSEFSNVNTQDAMVISHAIKDSGDAVIAQGLLALANVYHPEINLEASGIEQKEDGKIILRIKEANADTIEAVTKIYQRHLAAVGVKEGASTGYDDGYVVMVDPAPIKSDKWAEMGLKHHVESLAEPVKITPAEYKYVMQNDIKEVKGRLELQPIAGTDIARSIATAIIVAGKEAKPVTITSNGQRLEVTEDSKLAEVILDYFEGKGKPKGKGKSDATDITSPDKDKKKGKE